MAKAWFESSLHSEIDTEGASEQEDESNHHIADIVESDSDTASDDTNKITGHADADRKLCCGTAVQ